MDLANLAADRIEARPDWLAAAFTALSRLPIDTCMDAGIKKTAYDLVEAIEADCIPCPEVRRNSRGWITILFRRGDCSLEFIITAPGVFQVIRFSAYERSRKTHHKGWPGNAARDAIRWLYPSSHSTDEKGMYQVMREGL